MVVGDILVILAVREARVFFCVRQAVFRATGWPSSRSFEGRYAPRSPNPHTDDENTVPAMSANRRSMRAEATQRAPTFKIMAWREKLRPPWSPASTPRFDDPPRAAKLESEHTTGCMSMHGPRPASGTPPDCSGETCSLSEETKASQRQQLVPLAMRHDTATRACHTPVGHASSGGARCPLCETTERWGTIYKDLSEQHDAILS